jgi:hypothetical protein
LGTFQLANEDCPIGKEMPLQMTGNLRWTLLIEAEKKKEVCSLTLNRSGFRTNKEAKQWRFYRIW